MAHLFERRSRTPKMVGSIPDVGALRLGRWLIIAHVGWLDVLPWQGTVPTT